MKIKITYTPAHEGIILSLIAFVRRLCPGVRVHRSDKNPERKVVYLST